MTACYITTRKHPVPNSIFTTLDNHNTPGKRGVEETAQTAAVFVQQAGGF